MQNYLVIDAGGTKCDFVLIDPENKDNPVLGKCRTEGINAILTDKSRIEEIIGSAHSQLGEACLAKIFFYGAGCATREACNRVAESLHAEWPDAEMQVASDMLGAARGMLGHSRGIACILGTGSNSCLYDGQQIADGIPSLGYILGDEGSGAALGKRLLNDVFKKQLPQYICDDFKKEFDISVGDVLARVYHKPEANRYLAGFVPFLSRRLIDPYVYQLVLREFTRFVKRNILPYSGAGSLPIAFTGSISLHFEKILREAASQVGVSIKTIEASPLEGLVRYHCSQ